MYQSNLHVTEFSYGSNTRDVMGRVSRSQATFDVVATASSRSSRLEFQHSSFTFEPRILAAIVGTSGWRACPAVGNASVNDADTAAIATFFFATDGKTFMPPFNC
jgi:hypothetical protein